MLADEVKLSEQGVSVTADKDINCNVLPTLKVEGPLSEVFSPDRAALNKLLPLMATGLSQSCPDIDTLQVEGSDAGIGYSFTIARIGQWKLPEDAVIRSGAAAGPAAPQVRRGQTLPGSRSLTDVVPSENAGPPMPPAENFAQLWMDNRFGGNSQDDLLRMILAAKPELLADRDRLRQLYAHSGGTFVSTYSEDATLDAFYQNYSALPVAGAIRVALLNEVRIPRDQYSFRDSAVPLSINTDVPGPVEYISVDPFSDLQIVLPIPTLPKRYLIPMTPPQATDFEGRYSASSNQRSPVVLVTFLEISKVAYVPERDIFTAEIVHYGTELRERLSQSNTNFGRAIYRWGPQPESPLLAAREDGYSLAEFATLYGMQLPELGFSPDGLPELWSRIAASRVLELGPDRWENDVTVFQIAQDLLTEDELELFLQEKKDRGFGELNAFERKDLAARIRDEFAKKLKSRRLNEPIVFRKVYPVTLGDYSFARETFSLNIQGVGAGRFPGDRQISAALEGALPDDILPNELSATEAQGRQMLAFLTARRDYTLYLSVEGVLEENTPLEMELGERGASLPARAEIKRVALFADEKLKEIVVDYTALSDAR